LRQVLFNLLGNALKFTSQEDGEVSLNVTAISSADNTPCVQFRIIDNGIGMSDKVLASLFQAFTQADASTARKFGGTGLGLSITQRLVSLMHGKIGALSSLGKGSEFFVELPLQETQAPADRPTPTALDLQGIKILAVNGNLTCPKLVQSYLTAAHAEVHFVDTLDMAYAQINESKGETILLLDTMGHASTSSALSAAHILRLISRHIGNQAQNNEIHGYPLFFDDLVHAVAVTSGRLTRSINEKEAIGRSNIAGQAPSIEQALKTNRLVLLAEDNETNREVLLEQLNLIGYAAEAAEDGAIALKKWRTGRYALLLTDCHMPNMDGFELTAEIRKGETPGKRFPIIAITANAMQGEAERCRERGI
jgi:CheY-like chemotaxis protein